MYIPIRNEIAREEKFDACEMITSNQVKYSTIQFDGVNVQRKVNLNFIMP